MNESIRILEDEIRRICEMKTKIDCILIEEVEKLRIAVIKQNSEINCMLEDMHGDHEIKEAM